MYYRFYSDPELRVLVNIEPEVIGRAQVQEYLHYDVIDHAGMAAFIEYALALGH